MPGVPDIPTRLAQRKDDQARTRGRVDAQMHRPQLESGVEETGGLRPQATGRTADQLRQTTGQESEERNSALVQLIVADRLTDGHRMSLQSGTFGSQSHRLRSDNKM